MRSGMPCGDAAMADRPSSISRRACGARSPSILASAIGSRSVTLRSASTSPASSTETGPLTVTPAPPSAETVSVRIVPERPRRLPPRPPGSAPSATTRSTSPESGGTGAAPTLFRDNISVPTIPALARARRHLDRCQRPDVTLIITGGLRLPADFIKALALGADVVALSNSALQAIGCLGMRACNSNNCPVGIATQKADLRQRLEVERSARRQANFLHASTELIQVMARACGHRHVADFNADDLTTWKRDMAELAGVAFGGVGTA